MSSPKNSIYFSRKSLQFFPCPCLCVLSTSQPALISLQVPELLHQCSAGWSHWECQVSPLAVLVTRTAVPGTLRSTRVTLSLTVERRQAWIQPRVLPEGLLGVTGAMYCFVFLSRKVASLKDPGLRNAAPTVILCFNANTTQRQACYRVIWHDSFINDLMHAHPNVLGLSVKRKPTLLIFLEYPMSRKHSVWEALV